jgi:hypothetical protein
MVKATCEIQKHQGDAKEHDSSQDSSYFLKHILPSFIIRFLIAFLFIILYLLSSLQQKPKKLDRILIWVYNAPVDNGRWVFSAETE